MKVFICFAPSDARTANKLALDLLKRGIEVWIDQPDPSGETVDPEQHRADIQNGILDADVFVLVISPTALTSPDWHDQLDFAREQGKPIYQAIRQQVALTREMQAKLEGSIPLEFGRTTYDEGLSALLANIGVADEIVNDIVSSLESEEWLPGDWDVRFYNPRTALYGTATYDFKGDKRVIGDVTVQQDQIVTRMRVNGTWQFIHDRLTIQGTARMTMSIEEAPLPRNITYVLSLRIVDLERGRFHGVSDIGDKVIFKKAEEAVS